MTCPRCGIEIKDEQAVCLQCGTLLTKNIIDDKRNSKKFHYTTKLGLIILVVFIIVCLLVSNEIRYKNILSKITTIENIKVDEIHNINNLYKSDGRHYKYILDDRQKEIYIKLLNSVKNFDNEIEINTDKIKYPSEYLLKVFDAINMDHPELLQLGSFKISEVKVNSRIIHINYVLTKEENQKAVTETEKLIETIKNDTKDMNNYDKSKHVYEYLSKNNTYNTNDNIMGMSSYSALNGKHEPNHLGYSKASQILLQNLNINSIITIGLINNKTYSWNLVNLNNKYYYFDVPISSYDKEEIRYAGFLKNSQSYSYIYIKLIPRIKNKY